VGLRNDREVHALGGGLRGAVELIKEGGVRRARALRERPEGRLTAFGTRPLVAGVTGEHHAVDHQRVLAGREQLREPHVGRCAVRTCPLEDIVLRDWPTGRKLTPRGGHCLHHAAQLDLLLEQPITRRTVLC
jgi:hypothetical protein